MYRLERPLLMYKRQGQQTHESLVETLDYLHKTVEELKDDSTNTRIDS